MDVRVVGREALIRGQTSARARGTSRSSRSAARARAARATHAGARHARAWRARGSRDARASPAEATRPRATRLHALPIALEFLQREMQAAAPFAECGVRLREQPRNAGDARKLDLAAGAAPRSAGLGERRVAARAREKLAQRVGGSDCVRFVAQAEIVAGIRRSSPCTAHVK